ncbi:MAG: hypothetical protein C6P37_01400 [Caldibacillus debilis]|uniref:Uncharacterized protein n=1 Tax=Caldibacillus debilis TaxID=301148 RepID=A0A3E0K8I8_9BACI|nr:MAG: hypothetical protein C6P37_01400 [Caldibacillus debilis]
MFEPPVFCKPYFNIKSAIFSKGKQPEITGRKTGKNGDFPEYLPKIESPFLRLSCKKVLDRLVRRFIGQTIPGNKKSGKIHLAMKFCRIPNRNGKGGYSN